MKFYEANLTHLDRKLLKEKGLFVYYTAEGQKYTPVTIDEIIVIDKPSPMDTYTSLVSTADLSEHFNWTGSDDRKFMLLRDLEQMSIRVNNAGEF